MKTSKYVLLLYIVLINRILAEGVPSTFLMWHGLLQAITLYFIIQGVASALLCSDKIRYWVVIKLLNYRQRGWAHRRTDSLWASYVRTTRSIVYGYTASLLEKMDWFYSDDIERMSNETANRFAQTLTNTVDAE